MSEKGNFAKTNEERERKALVHDQDQKKATLLFMIAATAVEIVMSFLCIAILYIGFGLVIYRVIGAKTPAPLQLLSPVIFIGGIFLGYKAHKKLLRLVIDKANLKDRLRSDVYDQYRTRKERRIKDSMR